jgi:hypothetical protein
VLVERETVLSQIAGWLRDMVGNRIGLDFREQRALQIQEGEADVEEPECDAPRNVEGR